MPDTDYISKEVIKLSEKNPPLVNILWTGGLDSSFTMVYLSKTDVIIQPYYIRDNRKSEEKELNAIAEITADILKHPETKCKILPLKIYMSSEIEPDAEITSAFHRLRDTTNIGSQYDWLARFAKSVDGLLLNIEKSENSKIHNCIKQYGRLKRIEEGYVSYCVLDEEKSTNDLVLILKSFHLSLPLLETTKPEIYEYFKKLGFKESADKTWFCLSPVNGKPCGICNPCKTAICDGMTFRFTGEALERFEENKKQRFSALARAFVKKVLVKLGLMKTIKKILNKTVNS
ncbi:MAG: 7-cyano-7-deazaguanine synthase [Spirochaetales bacterium]|nr:7-cyano-7-deazaguanine synthase [Spirochaetales bacterium]